jgi:hypothetical protein
VDLVHQGLSTMLLTTIAPQVKNSFPLLNNATQDILDFAFDLEQKKKTLSKKEYKELLRNQKWEHEDKVYLKIAQIFKNFPLHVLNAIEPNTLFVLAKNNKKYSGVISQLLTSEEINAETVRRLMKKHRKPKIKKDEQPSIWRTTPQGFRYAQIPPMHDEITGVTLQGMMDSEGLSAQKIVAEAISLRQALKEGRLTWVSDSRELSILLEEVVEDELSVNIEEIAASFISSDTVTCGSYFDEEIDYFNNGSIDYPGSTSHGSDELFYYVENITDECQQEVSEAELEFIASNQCSESSETQSVRTIEICDRVIWTKCPPHLSTWQPFVVSDIRGEFAKLEYYQHPVAIVDLILMETFEFRQKLG